MPDPEEGLNVVPPSPGDVDGAGVGAPGSEVGDCDGPDGDDVEVPVSEGEELGEDVGEIGDTAEFGEAVGAEVGFELGIMFAGFSDTLDGDGVGERMSVEGEKDVVGAKDRVGYGVKVGLNETDGAEVGSGVGLPGE